MKKYFLHIFAATTLAILFLIAFLPQTTSSQEIESQYSVDLTWSTDTTTPELFEGRALITQGSNVTVHAFVRDKEGNVLNPDDFNFIWSFDGYVVGDVSGKGEDTYSFTSPPQKFGISVEIREGARVLAQDGESIQISSPKLILYEFRPLFGVIREQALGESILVNREEVTIEANGFYFSPSPLAYTWTREGVEFVEGVGQNRVTFGRGENNRRDYVRLRVQNERAYFQRLERVFSLTSIR